MEHTRLSLYYVASYLIFGGLGWIFFPDFFLWLFLSNGDYGSVMPRFVGVMMVGLGLLVLQIIRHHVQSLYSSTLAIRVFFSTAILSLYFYSKDPLFLVLFAVVAFGMVLTTYFYFKDSRKSV